jgi:hypothetical protein
MATHYVRSGSDLILNMLNLSDRSRQFRMPLIRQVIKAFATTIEISRPGNLSVLQSYILNGTRT